METVMTIRKALSTKRLYDNEIFNYVSDFKEMRLEGTLTGTTKTKPNQYLETHILCWRIVKGYSGQIFLIASDDMRNNKLWLEGSEGCQNGPNLLNEICRTLYSNSGLGLVAESINMMDIRNIPIEYFPTTTNYYWVANRYEKKRTFFKQEGMLILSQQLVLKKKLKGLLSSRFECGTLLPIIKVPDNQLIDIKGKQFISRE